MNSNKSFGLDISTTSIRAVSLSRHKNGFLLDSSFVMPTPVKNMLSSSDDGDKEMAAALKKVVANAKIKTKNVNVALPENQVYVNIVEMPILSDSDLETAIHWEADQYIPKPLSEINLVWSVLKKDEKVRILIVGAPTQLINKYYRVMRMANLNMTAIETEILSVIRTVVYNKEGSQNSAFGGRNFPHTLIINIREQNTSLAIIKEGILIFTYSIPTGGGAINRALEADFGLSMSESEEYKKVYGMLKEGVGGKIRMSIEPILASILNDLKKALAFYVQKYKGNTPIQQIVVCGGTAKLPGIQVFIADNFGIETVAANPWAILEEQNLPEEMLDRAPEYSVAVGLAMRDYE